jgi:hypothetical protein
MTDNNEKKSKLKLHLKAYTGFQSKEEHEISLNQWIDIQKVLSGNCGWIPLTKEVINDMPDVKFFMVWSPERGMWFHVYRRLGEWVCAELGDQVKGLTFTHYHECIKGPNNEQ